MWLVAIALDSAALDTKNQAEDFHEASSTT